MQRYAVYLWKQFPFVRFLLPFMAGIIFQWYLQLSLTPLIITLAFCVALLFSFYLVSEKSKFSLHWLQGIFIQLIFLVLGACITYEKDIRHHAAWIGNHYVDSTAVLVTIEEPLVEKSKSYKALATVDAIKVKGEWKQVEGKTLIYFKKDTVPSLQYGSQIIFTKPLQNIKSSGNPGAFDYQRYCAFQDIYYQVFLKQNEYATTANVNKNWFQQWLYDIRFYVINALRQSIKPEREAGVAEALLIGYRDDLDKDLVQAYSNTGVVHIIAISGLHLGLIYGTLVWLFRRFKQRRWIKWVKPIVILFVLWIFTLVAGAAPSIVRSAVMFTCIVLGEVIDRRSSIYNTLAASAFLMLCYNPFYLWDVGFQLSYAAVISIIAFFKPVYNWFYLPNKTLDSLWKLTAVTISAQILTVPFVLYHFHQFPNLFLITNFVAVPLSSGILYLELVLLLFSWLPVVAGLVGKVCSFLLWVMNSFVERTNDISFAVTDNIQLSLIEAILLFTLLVFGCYWLLRKSKMALFSSLLTLTVLIILFSVDNYKEDRQQKLIVYNIPQHTAIDFINGTGYSFIGDTSILSDNFLQNFHLKPARTLHQVEAASPLYGMTPSYPFIQFFDKKILLIDQPLLFTSVTKIPVDVIIISKNPRIYINDLVNAFDCKQFVFDASNPAWKINLWKKDCDNLHLRHHSTAENGAFELDL